MNPLYYTPPEKNCCGFIVDGFCSHASLQVPKVKSRKDWQNFEETQELVGW